MNLLSIKDAHQKSILKSFDCGNDELNIFLRNFAWANDHNGVGKTYVLMDKNNICGFFTLSSAKIKKSSIIEESNIKLPCYPISAIRLARLAVDKKYQKQGLGALLLKEAFIKIINASSVVEIYLIAVEEKNNAIGFYKKYGFKRLDNKTYYINLDTIKEAVEQ